MISFANDYNTGAHPAIIKKLTETNFEYLPGYETDKYCESAREKICQAIGVDSADVEFLVGGTQANAAVISTMLSDYEGVIATNTGHISFHEAGAIEYTGHEVLEIPHNNGKITPNTLNKYLADFHADANHDHMTFPGMVYISHPTEYGTLYSKTELEQISGICHQYNIPLYLDGARLGYGLMSKNNDVTLSDITNLCDVFCIGGTKVGALCGEAIVFTKGNKPKHFTTSAKRRGALLAKGRLLGIQFDTLFTDNLYFQISAHAIDSAERMKATFLAHGLKLHIDSPTNQQFVILENHKMQQLAEKIAFSFWEKYDGTHTVVRFATSWSTTEADLTALEEALDLIF